MFAFYTFKWHDSNDLQRIMWWFNLFIKTFLSKLKLNSY
jgi:hypothetical protein